jgi:hypothetical protein
VPANATWDLDRLAAGACGLLEDGVEHLQPPE